MQFSRRPAECRHASGALRRGGQRRAVWQQTATLASDASPLQIGSLALATESEHASCCVRLVRLWNPHTQSAASRCTTLNHLGTAWQIHPRQLPVPCQQQSITSPATTNTMSSRRTSARLSNDAPSSVATTSAVTLNGSKRKDDQVFGDGKTARTGKKPKVPPPPPSERKIARRRESTRQIRARDQSDSPPLFPVKRSRLPTEGLDGGSLQDELGHERVRWDAKVGVVCWIAFREHD